MFVVLLVALIVLSKDMEKMERASRSVTSEGYIRSKNQTFFFNTWIYWLINVGVSHLLKLKCRLNSPVYVGVNMVCLSAWMDCLAFFPSLVSKGIGSEFWKNWVCLIQAPSNILQVINWAQQLDSPVRYMGAKTRFLWLGNVRWGNTHNPQSIYTGIRPSHREERM